MRSASHRRIIRRELRLVVTPTATKFRVGARREIRGGLVDCPCQIHVSGGGLLGGLPRVRERRRWLNDPAPVDFVAQSPRDSGSARQREEDG